MQFLLLLPLFLILECYYFKGPWQEETLNALLLVKFCSTIAQDILFHLQVLVQT